jgi:hemoglobin-like flavoprotein
MMTTASLHRIRASFGQLSRQMPQVTGEFYDRLFELLPQARSMFKIDMDTQKQHFAAALALIVRNSSMLESLGEPLRELGADHARLGVCPDHYGPLCDAVLFAMARTLETQWTEQLAADWRALLDFVVSQMLAGSQT